ncbi:MAG: hypothetical protein HYU59_04905 [Magnetospirillum gryphiswaldense]|nr:hypothetical protein [Magnetospirillum gryphiswaldense]
MTLQEWIDARGMLNHYMLKNRVLNILYSISRDPVDCQDDIAIIEQWVTRRQEYEQFFAAAVDVFSSAHIFDDSPMAQEICQGELENWRRFAQQVYLGGTGIERKIAKMNELLDSAVDLVKKLSAAQSVSEREKVTDELRHCTAKLSSAISAFPSNIVSIIAPLE